jgi:hypothetical protein
MFRLFLKRIGCAALIAIPSFLIGYFLAFCLAGGTTFFHWCLVIAPSAFYPSVVLAYRQILNFKWLEIESLMKRDSARAYIERYSVVQEQPAEELFALNYHWTTYLLPVVVNMVVTTAGAVAFAERLGASLNLSDDVRSLLEETPEAVLAGVLGGYLFGLYILVRRYREIDLSGVSMHDLWLRMLFGATLGWAIDKVFVSPIDVWVALGVGAFPLKELRDLMKKQARIRLQMAHEPESEPPTLQLVQGVTPQVLERLAEEGIDSTEHLAYADPIKLLLRTKIEWKMILDLIDQSILLTYVYEPAHVQSLRTCGIRGAIEMSKIELELLDRRRTVKDDANEKLSSIAKILNTQEVNVKSIMQTMRRDPQVVFIATLWGEAFDVDPEDPSRPKRKRKP